VDAGPCGTFAAAQPCCDLAVLELGNDPQLDCLAVESAHLRHGRAKSRGSILGVCQGIHASNRLVVELWNGDAELAYRSKVDRTPAEVVGKLLARDPKEPCASGVAGVAEVTTALIGEGEGLSQQIGGHLRLTYSGVEMCARGPRHRRSAAVE
jgi:hypothetical protein